MALGTCSRCGARVVWDPSEIAAHLARCKQQVDQPAHTTPTDTSPSDGAREDHR